MSTPTPSPECAGEVDCRSKVTGREAAEQLDVPAKRVAKWIEDGKVSPVGLIPGRSRGGKGVPTFELEAFRPLAEAYHARTRART